MLAILGFLTVIIMLVLIMTKKASPLVALIAVPVVTGIISCFFFVTDPEAAPGVIDAAANFKALGGFITGKSAYSENSLTRTGTLTVYEGSSFETNFGSIDIISAIGTADSITTFSEVDAGGFVTIGDAETKLMNSVDSKVIIKSDVSMKNRFGTINI